MIVLVLKVEWARATYIKYAPTCADLLCVPVGLDWSVLLVLVPCFLL